MRRRSHDLPPGGHNSVIYLLHGQDTYSLRGFLNTLREAVGMVDVRDANTTTLSASEADPATFAAMCQAMPFLAERRLVIIEGLLASLAGEGRGGRGRGGGQRAVEWGERIATLRDAMPPTTDLIFVEGQLRPNHPLLRDLSAVAEVREFAPLNSNDLRGWVQTRVMACGGSMTTQAVQLLVDLVGPDLWALSTEVEKLTLYATGRAVTVEDVEELVVSAREVTVFVMVDGVLEGNRAGGDAEPDAPAGGRLHRHIPAGDAGATGAADGAGQGTVGAAGAAERAGRPAGDCFGVPAAEDAGDGAAILATGVAIPAPRAAGDGRGHQDGGHG